MADWVENRLVVSGPLIDLRPLHDLVGNDFDYTGSQPADLQPGQIWEWRVEHWGTDRSAQNVRYTTDYDEHYWMRWDFETAYNPPSGVIKQLALLHPTLHFHLDFELADGEKGTICACGEEYVREGVDVVALHERKMLYDASQVDVLPDNFKQLGA